MQALTTPFIAGMAAILFFATAAQAEPSPPPAKFELEAADGHRLVSEDLIGAILEIAESSDAARIRIRAVAAPNAPAAGDMAKDVSATLPVGPAS